MGILAENKNQLNYIYSSESKRGKDMLGYLKSIDKKIRTIDIAKDNIGDTLWVDIASKVKKPLSSLFSLDHPDAPSVDNAANFSTNDWLKIIAKTPALFVNPIVISFTKAQIIYNSADLMQFYGVDSAGLEKTMHTDVPKTATTTKGEGFIR